MERLCFCICALIVIGMAIFMAYEEHKLEKEIKQANGGELPD